MRRSGAAGGGNRMRVPLLPCCVLPVQERHEHQRMVCVVAQDGLAQHAIVAKAVALVDAAGAGVGLEYVQPEAMRMVVQECASHRIFEQQPAASEIWSADSD